MLESSLRYLWCPNCQSDLKMDSHVLENGRVKEGSLRCNPCKTEFTISNFIPRFVQYSSYAASFGNQWNAFARSQIDSPRTKESESRFDNEIGWENETLKDKVVLEVGSGAGRFVDVVARRNPLLAIGLDITDAVDAAQSNVSQSNVQFIQGDILKSPVRLHSVDFAYSIGVLHHTPTPKTAFQAMVDLVKENGEVGLCLYENSLYGVDHK